MERLTAKPMSESVDVCMGGHLGGWGVSGGVKGSIEEGGGALISMVVFLVVNSHRKTAQEVESDRDAGMRSLGEVGGV